MARHPTSNASARRDANAAALIAPPRDSASATPPRPQIPFTAALLAVLLVAAAFRLHHLGEPDFWLDELHSLINSAGHRGEWESFQPGVIVTRHARYADLDAESSSATVVRNMSHDAHPPLYFLLLHHWRSAFGDGEFAVRSLSVLFSLFSLVSIAMAVRELAGPGAGLMAAALCAVQYAHVRMAQEARPYALGMACVCVTAWMLAMIEARWTTWSASRRVAAWVACGAAMLAAMLTHYFTATALLALGAYAVARWRGRARWGWVATSLVAAGLWCVLWLSSWLGQWDFIAHQPWLDDMTEGRWVRLLARLGDLPVRLLFVHEPFRSDAVTAALGALVIAASLVWWWKTSRRGGLMFAAWFALSALVFATIDAATGRQTLSHLRYTSMAAPGLAGWIACVTAAQRPRTRNILLIGLLLLMGLTLAASLPTPQNPESRRAVQILEAIHEPGDLIVFDAIGWPDFWASQLYLQVSHYWPRLNADAIVLNSQPRAELRKEMGQYRRLMVIAVPERDTTEIAPSHFRAAWTSPHVEQIGFIQILEKSE